MRSSGVPARAASTMQRTAARTSSSQSETVRIRVRSVLDDVHGLVVAWVRPVPTPVDSANRLLDLGVGPGVPGGPRQDDDLARLGHSTEERTAVAGEPLRQVDDDGAETAGGRLVLPQCLGGGLEQVLLVVELRHQAGPRRSVQPDDVGGPRAAPGQRIERAVGEVAQLPVCLHQGGLRGGMAGHRGEDPGLPGQGGPQCGGDHGRGHRSATAPGQLGRPEKLRHVGRR